MGSKLKEMKSFIVTEIEPPQVAFALQISHSAIDPHA